MTKISAAGRRATTAIVIPARMRSSRLPGKPLADIAGRPMIVHVWRKAIAAACGQVIVAAADIEIADAIKAQGGVACLTRQDLPSGSDRVADALGRLDTARRYQTVINLQGDLPAIDPRAIRQCLRPLADPAVDIATLAFSSNDAQERIDPNVVKVVAEMDATGTLGRARDFRRELPHDHAGPHLHHVGVYAYRRSALETFVKMPQSAREKAARLEQLRALDAGMRIDLALVDSLPLGVDTPADLDRARALLERS